jgi:hypothetical protein
MWMGMRIVGNRPDASYDLSDAVFKDSECSMQESSEIICGQNKGHQSSQFLNPLIYETYSLQLKPVLEYRLFEQFNCNLNRY